MWITREDYAKLENAVRSMFKDEYADVLKVEDVKALTDADEVFCQLERKRQKDNARCAAYIKNKRQDNPAYAGGYVRKKAK